MTDTFDAPLDGLNGAYQRGKPFYDNPREAARANARAKCRRYLEEKLSLQEAVYRTVGSAALCWRDGEYDEKRAKALARELVKFIETRYDPKADHGTEEQD